MAKAVALTGYWLINLSVCFCICGVIQMPAVFLIIQSAFAISTQFNTAK